MYGEVGSLTKKSSITACNSFMHVFCAGFSDGELANVHTEQPPLAFKVTSLNKGLLKSILQLDG